MSLKYRYEDDDDLGETYEELRRKYNARTVKVNYERILARQRRRSRWILGLCVLMQVIGWTAMFIRWLYE